MRINTEKVRYSILLSLFLFPISSFAASTLIDLSARFLSFLNVIPLFLVGFALIFFFYGLSGYLYSIDDKSKVAAKTVMINGVIGIFVMVSIWGIISEVRNIFGI